MSSSPAGNGPPGLLCTAADFVKRYPEISQSIPPEVIAELCLEATDHIEAITSRRLAPFTGHIYSDMLVGIYPDEYGQSAAIPTDIYASLGISYANALGANSLVRHFWLDQFAPRLPELWQYSIESMNLVLTYGNTTPIDFQAGGTIFGPSPVDGSCWLRLGTFAPQGTMVTVVYSGGYTGGIPAGLKRAALFQALKFAVLEAEPQLRSGLSLAEIDDQILMLLAPYSRA